MGRVADDALVAIYSVVKGEATVKGNATISASLIMDKALVQDRANVLESWVKDNSLVAENGVVREHSTVSDNAIICDNACLRGSMNLAFNRLLSGDDSWGVPFDFEVGDEIKSPDIQELTPVEHKKLYAKLSNKDGGKNKEENQSKTVKEKLEMCKQKAGEYSKNREEIDIKKDKECR